MECHLSSCKVAAASPCITRLPPFSLCFRVLSAFCPRHLGNQVFEMYISHTELSSLPPIYASKRYWLHSMACRSRSAHSCESFALPHPTWLTELTLGEGLSTRYSKVESGNA